MGLFFLDTDRGEARSGNETAGSPAAAGTLG
jgi:hypothetical protein